MISNVLKRFLIVCLVLMMIVSMAACGKSGNDNNNANNDGPDNGEDIVNEPLYKMDPVVEMSVIKQADTFFGYKDDQTPSDNAVYDLWEDTIGIRFINKIECATEAFDQKVKLSIMSDDLPDMIAASAADFDEMIKNDMIYDLSYYIDKYMAPDVREKLFAFDGKLFAPVTRGDKIYGLPATSNVEGSLRTMWIRKDWLEAVGKEVPTTMEEVIELAKLFTTGDPDGNGKDDTYGLPIDKDVNTSLLNTYEIVANAFGYYPSRRITDENGKIVFGSMDAGLKEVLGIFNELYEMGALDPEFASKDFMQVDEDIAADKYGLWLGVFWKPVDPGMQTTYKEGVEWIAAPIPSSEKVDAYRPFVAFPANAYYGINKNYEHPEALIAAVNSYLTMDYSNKESFAYKGKVLGSDPKFQGIPTNNWAALQWQDPTFFDASPIQRALDDPNFDPENPQFPVHMQAYNIISGNTNPEPWQQIQFTDIFLRSVAVHENYPMENYVFDSYYGAPTDTMQSKGSILDDLEDKIVIDIITGNEKVSAYDDFMKEYMNLGGEKILEEMNQ